MKKSSDNFRDSSVQKVMYRLRDMGVKVIIYEPLIQGKSFDDFEVVNKLEEFKNISDIIIANRMNSKIEDVKDKVYTRDLFNND